MLPNARRFEEHLRVNGHLEIEGPYRGKVKGHWGLFIEPDQNLKIYIE